jgi:hypothetical protein
MSRIQLWQATLAASVSLAAICPFSSAIAGDDEITFKVSRRQNASRQHYLMAVFVNGNKIGTVADGKDVAFRCAPTDAGKYTIWVQQEKPGEKIVFGGEKSKQLDFELQPGAVVKAITEFKGYISQECILDAEVVTSGKIPVEVISAKLEDDYVERELTKELVETLPGIKRTIKRSRTIEHTVSVTETTGLDASVKAGIGVISGEIKGRVEKALGQSFRQSETVEQVIEIDGNKLPEVTLQWVEKYRKGVASIKVNGVDKKVPFEFRENIELRIKRVAK